MIRVPKAIIINVAAKFAVKLGRAEMNGVLSKLMLISDIFFSLYSMLWLKKLHCINFM